MPPDHDSYIELVVCHTCKRAWNPSDGTRCKGCGHEGLVVVTLDLWKRDAS